MSLDPAGLRARATALRALRDHLDAHGYLEVPTPTLVPSPAMEPTLVGVPAADGWLRTSPEFALKRAMAAGLPRIYEIGPCFRADEAGPWHAREFTMLEWYRAGATQWDLADEATARIDAVAAALGVPAPGPWVHTTVRDLFVAATGVDLATASAAELSPAHPDDHDDWDAAFFRRWVEDVEPTLSGALVIHDWPASQAALARVRPHRAWPTACRFEIVLDGVELANAFLELTDPDEQARRVAHSRDAQRDDGAVPHPVDDAFVEAVGHLPPCAGIAVGVDRLVAVLLGAPGIAAIRADHPTFGP